MMRAVAFEYFDLGAEASDGPLSVVSGLGAVRAAVLVALRMRPGEDPFGRIPGVDWIAYLHARKPDLDGLQADVSRCLLAVPGLARLRRLSARRSGAQIVVDFEAEVTGEASPLVLALALDPTAQSVGEILSPWLLLGAPP
jgi:hypothetical protein